MEESQPQVKQSQLGNPLSFLRINTEKEVVGISAKK